MLYVRDGALTRTPPPLLAQQLRPGLPPGLRYVGLFQFNIESVVQVLSVGFPMVRIARIEDNYYSVQQTPNGTIKVEEWPHSRTQYNVTEWLEWYDCQYAQWLDPTEFL